MISPHRIHVAWEQDLESLFIAFQELVPRPGPIYKVLIQKHMLDDNTLTSVYLRDYAIDMIQKETHRDAPDDLGRAIITGIAQYRMLI